MCQAQERCGEDPVSQHLPEEPVLPTAFGPGASRTERESVPIPVSPPFVDLGHGSPRKLRHRPVTEANVSFSGTFQESGAQWPCASESLTVGVHAIPALGSKTVMTVMGQVGSGREDGRSGQMDSPQVLLCGDSQ